MKFIKIKNKKSQVFTLVAIALIILFFASFEIYSIFKDRNSIKTRVLTMDNFLFSIEKNLEREVYILGFRTIFLAEDRITRTGEHILNIGSFFDEAFFNGTIYGNSSEILIGVRYSDILQFLNEKASFLNVEIGMSNPEISVSQEDPWNVALLFSFNLTMTDKTNLASWNKQEQIKSLINIQGFEDPLYIINTNGKVIYKINRTAYSFSNNTISNLSKHVNERYYIENSDAPSFLDRLEGRTSGNQNGIESLVDLSELSEQGVAIQQKSVVDHIYFSSDNPLSKKIQGMSQWFELDDNHLSIYNVTGLAI